MTRMILLMSVVLGLAACETVEGLGQDVSAAGNELSETANEVQEDI